MSLGPNPSNTLPSEALFKNTDCQCPAEKMVSLGDGTGEGFSLKAMTGAKCSISPANRFVSGEGRLGVVGKVDSEP